MNDWFPQLVELLATEDGQLQGSVQIELAKKATGRHRAEVQKLLVHSRARRQSLGRRLMAAVEQEALAAGRTLLILDTRVSDPASKLYESMNYLFAGAIPATSGRTMAGLRAPQFSTRICLDFVASYSSNAG